MQTFGSRNIFVEIKIFRYLIVDVLTPRYLKLLVKNKQKIIAS